MEISNVCSIYAFLNKNSLRFYSTRTVGLLINPCDALESSSLLSSLSNTVMELVFVFLIGLSNTEDSREKIANVVTAKIIRI